VCAGGIIGLGEGDQDRVGLLLQLATLPEHPESVPINRLVAVKGTPLQVRDRGHIFCVWLGGGRWEGAAYGTDREERRTDSWHLGQHGVSADRIMQTAGQRWPSAATWQCALWHSHLEHDTTCGTI
jgi:hypothetical protein